MSNGRLAIRLGLTAWVSNTTAKVYPSAAAAATAAVPIEPEAPPLLSTTTLCPSCFCRGSARMRATWSTEPPGGNTATSLIGCLPGQAWAQAAGAAARPTASAAADAHSMKFCLMAFLLMRRQCSMAHLPYAELDNLELRPLVERIVAERGGVLHLYQMLLHSPPLAEGWLGFLTVVRQQLELSGALRELVIMRVAHLNGAPYEADQHAPLALKEGVTRAQLDALPRWESSGAFSPLQEAVLRLTDTMTRDVQVPPELMREVRAQLDNRQVVELVGTIAAYNMVSRFLEALQIHSDDARPTAPAS